MSDTTIFHPPVLEDLEDLDPELAAAVRETSIGPMIKHPLYVGTAHAVLNATANQALRGKKAALGEARTAGNWHQVLWLHERPFRIEAFLSFEDELDDRTYWRLLREVWEDSENVREWLQEVPLLFCGDGRDDRFHLMSDHEQAELEAMKPRLTVYRGCTPETEDGWSWTLDRSRAEWFAQRFASMHQRPVLLHGKVDRDDVIMYVESRGESEIVADRSHVRVFRKTNLEVK